MGCPGGCIAGGGQPIVRSCFLPNEDDNILDTYKEKRAKALYSEDERLVLRQSHNNEQIKALYASDYTQFPPQGIDINDSFFAEISTKAEKPAKKGKEE